MWIENFSMDRMDVEALAKETNKRDPKYLIINSETQSYLVGKTCYINKRYGGYTEYRGIPVAICDKLNFGEVVFVTE